MALLYVWPLTETEDWVRQDYAMAGPPFLSLGALYLMMTCHGFYMMAQGFQKCKMRSYQAFL